MASNIESMNINPEKYPSTGMQSLLLSASVEKCYIPARFWGLRGIGKK